MGSKAEGQRKMESSFGKLMKTADTEGRKKNKNKPKQ